MTNGNEKKTPVEEKTIWLAIGLNFVYLGAGYCYMGRKVLGVLLILIATGMATAMISYPILFAVIPTFWIGIFFITCVDMFLLQSRIKKASTKPCPYCAEPIRKEAIFCLHCKKDIVAA